MPTAGAVIRAARLRRGWTLRRLGLELAVSEATLSRWETGRSAIPEEAVVAAARILDDPLILQAWAAERPAFRLLAAWGAA